jgi:hypothetical protein
MCLFTKAKHPLIAQEDIVCYKIVHLDWHRGGGHFITPFQHTPIPDDVMSGECPFKATGKKSALRVENGYGSFSGNGLVIDSGYIHAWVDENVSLTLSDRAAVYKCIIPAGTKYYKGWFNGWAAYDSICAEEIKFIERIR